MLAGCGGGGETGPVNVNALVVSAHDLPGVEGVEPQLPEPCGPVSELQEGGGKAALSKRFVLREGQAVEAAAIFKAEAPARSAYEALQNPERLRCIATSAEAFTGSSKVKFERPQPFDIGDEAAVSRYRTSDPFSGRQGYSDIVFLRVGRCTASMLIVSGNQAGASRLASSTGRIAAELLGDACE